MDSAYVLDSFALIAHLEDEEGANRVAGLLRAAGDRKTKLYMSAVNFGEVYYLALRERGRQAAEEARFLMEQLPLVIVDADRELAIEAARLKAGHAIAYADCFAAALGMRRHARVVTGDPEFKKLEPAIRVEWI